MNAETVKKEFQEELLLLQLAGIAKSYQQERNNREELKILERDHQNEIYRLRGQKDQEQDQIKKFEQKRKEELRKHEYKKKEVETNNKKEEDKLREETMQLYKDNIRKATQICQDVADQLQKTFDQSLTLHDNLHKIEEVKNAKKSILEADRKWMDVKDSYDLMKEIYLTENQQENFDDETKKMLLGELGRLLNSKHMLDKYLMTVKQSLGKWKRVADEKCYQDVRNGLDEMSSALQKFEKALTTLRTKVKLNELIEENFLNDIDSIVSECHTLTNNLLLQPMSIKNTFQQMIEN